MSDVLQRFAGTMNKYNVKANRDYLDKCIRNEAWSQARTRLCGLSPDLLEAVTLVKTKLQSKHGGTLLHVLVKRRSCPDDILISIAKGVPRALFTCDRHQQSPLHILMDRGDRSIDLVRDLLEIATKAKDSPALLNSNDVSANLLTMTDLLGYNPLSVALRGERSPYIPLLLQFGVKEDCLTEMMLAKSKHHRRTCLFYSIESEMRGAYKHPQCHLSHEATLLLIATHFAIRIQCQQPWTEQEWLVFEQEMYRSEPEASFSFAISQGDNPPDAQLRAFPLLIQSFVSCFPLLVKKHAVKVLDFLLANDTYRSFIRSREIDNHGNMLLHLLCREEILAVGRLDSEYAERSEETRAILVHQLLEPYGEEQHPTALARANHEGNLPLHLAALGGSSITSTLARTYPAALKHWNHAGELPLHVALKHWKIEEDVSSTMGHLWSCQPEIAELRDRSSRLFPFQLAACMKTSHDSPKQVHPSEASWLNLVFTMLLSAPQTIAAT